jgi:hypothetical protein
LRDPRKVEVKEKKIEKKIRFRKKQVEVEEKED